MIIGRICVIVLLAFSLKRSLGKEPAVKTAWGSNYAEPTENSSKSTTPAPSFNMTTTPDQILDSNEPVARAREGRFENEAMEHKAATPASKAQEQTTPTLPVVNQNIIEKPVTGSMPEVNPNFELNKLCEEHVRNMKLVLDPILLTRLVAIGVLALLLFVCLIILSCVIGCACSE